MQVQPTLEKIHFCNFCNISYDQTQLQTMHKYAFIKSESLRINIPSQLIGCEFEIAWTKLALLEAALDIVKGEADDRRVLNFVSPGNPPSDVDPFELDCPSPTEAASPKKAESESASIFIFSNKIGVLMSILNTCQIMKIHRTKSICIHTYLLYDIYVCNSNFLNLRWNEIKVACW